MNFLVSKEDEVRVGLNQCFSRWIKEVCKEEGVSVEQKRREFRLMMGC